MMMAVLLPVVAAAAATSSGSPTDRPLFSCAGALSVGANFSWTLDAFRSPRARPAAGGPYALLYGGRWLSSADGSLAPAGQPSLGNGSDAHGSFSRLTLGWRPASAASAVSPVLWTTSFRCYLAHSGPPTVVFSQHFPSGLDDAPGGLRDFQVPSSQFPSFEMASLEGRPMITFKDGNAGHTLHAGVFPATYLGAHREQSVRGGLGGFTSGPVAFGLDPENLAGGPLLVLSPLNAFMAALHNIGSANSTLSWGVGGLMAKLPRGYRSDFVAVIHDDRDNSDSERYSGAAASAFMAWGDFLLREYGQVRTRHDANAWISQLGYSTTGTFHYNPCDCPVRCLQQHQTVSFADFCTHHCCRAMSIGATASVGTTAACQAATPTKIHCCRCKATPRTPVS